MTKQNLQETILVVDDAPDTLEVIQRNLASHQYRVLTAQSVEEAVAWLAQEPSSAAAGLGTPQAAVGTEGQ